MNKPVENIDLNDANLGSNLGTNIVLFPYSIVDKGANASASSEAAAIKPEMLPKTLSQTPTSSFPNVKSSAPAHMQPATDGQGDLFRKPANGYAAAQAFGGLVLDSKLKAKLVLGSGRQTTPDGRLKQKLSDFKNGNLAEIAAGEKVPYGLLFAGHDAVLAIQRERERLSQIPQHSPASDSMMLNGFDDPCAVATRYAALTSLVKPVLVLEGGEKTKTALGSTLTSRVDKVLKQLLGKREDNMVRGK